MKNLWYCLVAVILIVFLVECGPVAAILLPLGIILVLALIVSGCKF